MHYAIAKPVLMSPFRPICPTCQYPLRVCVCELTCDLSLPTRIVVLQHPSETGHAKNSVKILRLVAPDTQVIIGERPEDFAELKRQVESQKVAVFYPSEKARDFCGGEVFTRDYDMLIFIDASWRKAYKMWQENPWLWQCEAWQFSNPPAGQYDIRKTSVVNGLSTLEAVAYTIDRGYKVDTSELIESFKAIQKRIWLKPTSDS